MITCFSFARNGWVNYRFPLRNTLTFGAVDPAPRSNVPGFAYATREAAQAGDTSKPATPRAWSKYQPAVPFYV